MSTIHQLDLNQTVTRKDGDGSESGRQSTSPFSREYSDHVRQQNRESSGDLASAPSADKGALSDNSLRTRINKDEITKFTKKDGTEVEIGGGMVKAKIGDTTIVYECQKKNGKEVVMDSLGYAKVEKLRVLVNGEEKKVVDFGEDNPDNTTLRELGRVSLKKDSAGDLKTFSPDLKKFSTVKTDGSSFVYEAGVSQGKDFTRPLVTKATDGTLTEYSYYKEGDPNIAKTITQTSTNWFGRSESVVSTNIAGTKNYITETLSTGHLEQRNNLHMENGRLAYEAVSEKNLDLPKTSDETLEEAREKFLNTAALNGVFRGNKKQIEQLLHQIENRFAGMRQDGYNADSKQDTARAYNDLSRLLTEQSTGTARCMTKGEKRLLVEDLLYMAKDPMSYGNQGLYGTCAYASTANAVTDRFWSTACRAARQSATMGYWTTLGCNSKGQHLKVPMSEEQLKYSHNEFGRSYGDEFVQSLIFSSLGFGSDGANIRAGYPFDKDRAYTLLTGRKLAGHHDLVNSHAAGLVFHRKQDLIKALKNGDVAYSVTSPGPHAMLIMRYDSKTDRFLVNNTWGESKRGAWQGGLPGPGDGWIPARSLFR